MTRAVGAVAAVLWLGTAQAWGAPAKKEAQAFVQELQAAVKADQKTLMQGTPDDKRKHEQWHRDLKEKARTLFKDSGECTFAASSAAGVWDAQERYARKPDQVGYTILQHRQEDYRDNMAACRASVKQMK